MKVLFRTVSPEDLLAHTGVHGVFTHLDTGVFIQYR